MQANKQDHTRTLLAEKGLKATPQRIIILSALLARLDHPTAEALYAEVQTQLPGLSLGTVYSTLETFVQNALAKRVPVAEGSMRYDACTDNHHHIYCTNTSEILDFHDPELEQLIREHLEKKKIQNLDIQSISLHIRGSKQHPGEKITYL